ncbi:phage portal protein [Halalkalibacter okhensis]|uniref:phage portal protein n=1 Tax=Halalkalibacter okhensis TaxID=333138 RepID=UPI000AA88C4D|nr:phage portal protein [Halalkalibacter okhensis]
MVKDKLILNLIKELDKQRPKYLKLQQYYNGDHRVLHEKSKVDSTKSDERVFFNYCRKTVSNYTGYLLGKPVNYSHRKGDKEFLDTVDYYYSQWEKEHNINLKQQTEIYGTVFETAYINTDGEFRCAIFNPLEMIVLNDGSIERNVSVAVRKYQVPFDEAEYVDVWDNEHFSRYKLEEGLKQLEQKKHFFSRCPVTEIPNNDLKKSAFADIIRIVDVYNSINSTAANEIQDHRSAYLVIENANLTHEEAQKMKE